MCSSGGPLFRHTRQSHLLPVSLLCIEPDRHSMRSTAGFRSVKGCKRTRIHAAPNGAFRDIVKRARNGCKICFALQVFCRLCPRSAPFLCHVAAAVLTRWCTPPACVDWFARKLRQVYLHAYARADCAQSCGPASGGSPRCSQLCSS